MSQVIQASAGLSDQTGYSYQQHLVYLINSGKWLLSWQDNASDTTWKFLYNSTLDFTGGSWSVPTGSPFTLATAWTTGGGKSGALHSLAYQNIAANDVLHMDQFFNSSGSYILSHYRAHFSGTTVTVDTQNDLGGGGNPTTANGGPPFGLGSCLSTGGRPRRVDEVGAGTGVEGFVSAQADTGFLWTDDMFFGGTAIPATSQINNSLGACIFPLTNFNGVIAIYGDGSAATPSTMQNVFYTTYFTSTGWGTPTNVGFTALGAGVSANNFGAVGVTTADVHCVLRTGTNTLVHRRFNGSTWSAGQAIPNQNVKDGAGVFLASDGTNVWLFIIETDSANTVRVIKWTAATPAWDATWTAVETTTKTRNFISGSQVAASGRMGIIWTETNGGTFDIVGTTYADPVPFSATRGARPNTGYQTPIMSQFGGGGAFG